MAAIGGILDTDARCFESDALMKISRAMLIRGGHERQAYISRGMGVFCGSERGERCSLPVLCEADGKPIAAVLDGEINIGAFGEGERFLTVDGIYEHFAIEKYLSSGLKFCEELGGDFALALCDEGCGELLLLRGDGGGRPIFYTVDGGRVFFASEIKGLLPLLGEVGVYADVLREHVFSSSVKVGAELYRGIYEVPVSGGCLCTRLGVSRFFYVSPTPEQGEVYYSDIVKEAVITPDGEALRRMLREILFAFDYPQFDVFMPSFIENIKLVRDQKVRRFLGVEDGSLCMDIGYSRLRRDRLGAFFGARVNCVAPSFNALRQRELQKFEGLMWEIFEESNLPFLKMLLGNDLADRIRKEKSCARRIRSLGIVAQICPWAEQYNLLFF